MTRNKYADWIPAEGVEIPLLPCDEVLTMLFMLARIKIYEVSEIGQAQQIVRELGYLPLTIEQGVAYITQICNKTLSKFLTWYKENRLTIHEWVPFGGRQYSESLATTWILSVNAVRERSSNAACLLKFLAYLASDFILIQFLKAGLNGLDDDLKRVIANEECFDNAIFALGQFSLLKQKTTREGDGLVVHRLLQASQRKR
jgi:hypothetical protein